MGEADTVQRLTKLAVYDKKIQAAKGQEVQLKAIRTHLSTYHALKPKADPTYQARLQALRSLDTAIHAWFSLHVTGAIADVENGPYLQSLLASSQDEHRKMVAAIAKKPNLLPVDTTGMSTEERTALLQLWRSIVDGTGNLQIRSGLRQGKFRGRMLAGLAKLLQTPAGQVLLTEVNGAPGGKGKQVELGPTFAKQLKALGRTDPTDSQAVPKTQDGDVSSMAYADEKGGVPEGAKVVDYKGSGDPASFNTFLTTLPKGTTHFRFKGNLHKLGTGVGSFVKMAGKGDIHANIGTQGQEVLVPEFITLGHELGHSLRMLKGSTVPFVEDITKFGFAGNASEQRLWNGAEEYVNIMGVENELRQEHGMERRVFHAGDRALTQGPIFRNKIEVLLRRKDLEKSHKTEVDKLFKIYAALTLLPKEDAKLRMLLAPETLEVVRALESAGGEVSLESPPSVGKDKEKEDELSSSSSSVIIEKVRSRRSSQDLEGGREEVDRDDSGSDEESGGGSPYAVLVAKSRIRVEVPVDRLGLGREGGLAKKGSSGKKTKGSGGREFLHREDYGAALEQLGAWLKRNGIKVVPNGGGGRNNCLIISLLQHATGSSGEPKAKTVWRYKQQLLQLGIGENDELMPTDEAFRTLLTAINKDHGRNMKAVYVQAFKDLDPPYVLLESEIGADPVLIWDKLGHFEALV